MYNLPSLPSKRKLLIDSILENTKINLDLELRKSHYYHQNISIKCSNIYISIFWKFVEVENENLV